MLDRIAPSPAWNDPKTVAADGAPVDVYLGKVMHARLAPKPHRFSYRVFSILIDIDRIAAANAVSPIFSANQRGLIAFHEKDHGARDGSPLRQFVDRTLIDHGIEPADRVKLLCYPRVFGYTFNPLSVYFCHHKRKGLTTIIYQVHNTFGQSHCYVKAVDGKAQDAVIRQQADKQLYVSPFITMDTKYHFRVQPPADSVKIRILEQDRNGPLLSATFSGERHPFTTKALAHCLLVTLGLTWKVTVGIHYEALRLWLKGMKLVPRLAK